MPVVVIIAVDTIITRKERINKHTNKHIIIRTKKNVFSHVHEKNTEQTAQGINCILSKRK